MIMGAVALAQSVSPLTAPAPPSFPVAQPVEDLPAPSRDPLGIDLSADPVLALARDAAADDAFVGLIQLAVARPPRVDEAQAGIAEAEAAEDEARSERFPTADLRFLPPRRPPRGFQQAPAKHT